MADIGTWKSRLEGHIGNEYKSKGGMYPLYMHTALFLIDLDNSNEHGLHKFTLYVLCSLLNLKQVLTKLYESCMARWMYRSGKDSVFSPSSSD